ncbi:sigma 54-interacting transcriptional regulator [Enterococcus casseliflavus]|uniref:sigma 54-interacting transcriptional regulator n=1 Tax=Enterococcus casseliflavus TaxID=37734 RepID=UPI003D0FB239
MGRREEVLSFISECGGAKVTTADVSKQLLISRTAASRELNTLVREGQVRKEKGKPVQYFLNSEYQTNHLKGSESPRRVHSPNILIKKSEKMNAFSRFIGAEGSLSTHINSAKAAIMYPPNGLHTIILGSTGVGKSTFAQIMFQYGQEIGRFTNKSPFVHFNCADYSNNPQLLLSILFGYVKGAFTGADTEKAGIIEKSNHGVLFLDEIHRLPPEGQEMLFTIIDTQKFRRLGESDTAARKVNILILCATTESIDSSLLQTFKRRFPMVLTLPDLKDRTFKERLQLIDYFFCIESKKIEREIKVEKSVINYLASYSCSGNIGQLKNDIQILCAKEFAQAMIQEKNTICITLEHIEVCEVIQPIENSSIQDTVYFQGEKMRSEQSFPITVPDAIGNETSFYQSVLERYSTLLKEGRSIKEIQQKITSFIDDFFKVDLKPDHVDVQANKGIEKLVSKEILDIVEETIQEISVALEVKSDPHITYNLALHIEALVLKLQTSNSPYRSKKIVEPGSETHFKKYADKLISEINRKMGIQIPIEEQEIIELFLDTIYQNVRQNPIGILILMHGVGVATNLAKMVNDLLGISHAVGVDMPLEESIENVYHKALQTVKRIDRGSGVLLLADMGSFSSFPSKIAKETGIEIMVIDNVTSPIIIEATRKALFANMGMKKLVHELLEESTYFMGNKRDSNIFDYSSRRLIKNKDHLFYNSLEKSVIFLNVYKATEALDEILISLAKRMNFEIIDTLVIKFYFHCLGMLERAIRKESLDFEVKELDKDVEFREVKREVAILERMYGTTISDSEILYVTKIIKGFL